MTTFEIVTVTDGCAEMTTIESHASASFLIDYYSQTKLGSGVSRKVYKLNERLVLKVQYNGRAWGMHQQANKNEVALYNRLTDEERASGLFAHVYFWADDYSWIISEFVPNIGHRGDLGSAKNRAIINKYGVGDLHGENYGTREDGTVAIIDYGASDVSHSGGQEVALVTDSEGCDCGCCEVWFECECGECDCERCFPEGCFCATFEGCRMGSRTCEVCANVSNRLEARDILAGAANADRSWHPISGRQAKIRGGLPIRILGSLPKPALERLAAHAQDAASRARKGDGRAELHTGGFVDGEGNIYSADVCEECAQAKRDADMPDANQMVLQFSDRFQVGCKLIGGWVNGRYFPNAKAVYYVRDRFTGHMMTASNDDYAKVAANVAWWNEHALYV